MEKKSVIEGLLFLTGEDGLDVKQLEKILQTDKDTVLGLMEQLKEKYKKGEYGFELVEVAGSYKFMTKPELAPYIQRLIETPNKSHLSQAALETLAIIAYKQPITRAEIEDIRGVKTERALQTIASHALIKEVGRAEGAGRAILYGTTDEFLQTFGLRTLEELPPFPEELEGQLSFDEIELFEKNNTHE